LLATASHPQAAAWQCPQQPTFLLIGPCVCRGRVDIPAKPCKGQTMELSQRTGNRSAHLECPAGRRSAHFLCAKGLGTPEVWNKCALRAPSTPGTVRAHFFHRARGAVKVRTSASRGALPERMSIFRLVGTLSFAKSSETDLVTKPVYDRAQNPLTPPKLVADLARRILRGLGAPARARKVAIFWAPLRVALLIDWPARTYHKQAVCCKPQGKQHKQKRQPHTSATRIYP
jgi:hypothetical protein